ncbi:hypothetical protein PUN28_013512 [Cardiocondyla obscurior]|uniref:Uncharacterized protein n=1 Tax=Cardiocondyla obscurior TaxID=286306 RepID=A0AAW2F5D1_9HYME
MDKAALDDRAAKLNPNNPEFKQKTTRPDPSKDNRDNRANQLNPNNELYKPKQ